MAIKRVSDLEKYSYDSTSGQELSAFLQSPEYLYSCIEVSQNKNGEEHSQFQSMRMDIGDLQQYMEYNVIYNDIAFEGNKSFVNKVIMSSDADVYGNFAVRSTGTVNTATIDASTIQLSSRNLLKLNAINTTLSARDITAIKGSNIQLSSYGSMQLSAANGNLSCYATTYIALDTPSTTRTVLSGQAEKIIFKITDRDIDNKFKIDAGGGTIMWVDAADMFHFAQPIHAISLSARWADLAEYYIADEDYEPGTLVKFGGKYELTKADVEANAVVTSKPGLILNSNLKLSSEHQQPVAIALTGRTPVKVKGKVKKFQNLMLSQSDAGIAIASDGSRPTIGKALEDKLDDSVSLVNCVVNLRL